MNREAEQVTQSAILELPLARGAGAPAVGVTAPQEPAVEAHPVGQVGLPLYLEHKGPVLPFPGPPPGSPAWGQRAGLCWLPSLRGSSRLPGAVQELPPSSELS